MSYDPDDAAYDAWIDDLYLEHKALAWSEISQERLQSYYRDNPDVMRPAVDSLQEESACCSDDDGIKPDRSQRQINHYLRENKLALIHRSLRRKSAKSSNFAPRRSNRDQDRTPIYASKSLTYDSPM